MNKVFPWLLLAFIAAGTNAEWQEPENLGPVINSVHNDWYPVIPEDGSYMIFVSDRPGGYGSFDLWISYNVGGEWQPPQNLGAEVNTAGIESAPFLADEDTTLYFVSSGSGGYGSMDIWTCPLTDGVPGTKTNIGPEINTAAHECCPAITTDGQTLYICSDRAGSLGQMDIWVSEKSGGTWGEPYNIGSVLNTSQTDCPRWLSDDGDTLLITTGRAGGYGLTDLWYAVKSGEDWNEPVNMGPEVNSYDYELGPGFYCNHGDMGGVIYFGSGRSGGEGGWDIWMSVDSDYANVAPTSLGRSKAIFR
ncbi:MAG: PD40 domain-containing protein [Candidatus Coatesbacteria bacterium]|nr:MAG: PD40 domain-containing protein [Candidatus Coatesbacteria bacterium]